MELHYTDHYKYLGVTLVCNLNYQKYAPVVFQKSAHKIYILSKIRQYLTRDAALQIYKTKIIPYLDYGDILYMGTRNETTTKFQRLQNRALKVCIWAEARYPTDCLHFETKTPMLEKRRMYHPRNFMFKRSGGSRGGGLGGLNPPFRCVFFACQHMKIPADLDPTPPPPEEFLDPSLKREDNNLDLDLFFFFFNFFIYPGSYNSTAGRFSLYTSKQLFLPAIYQHQC